jgi:hypothetical protein
MPPHDPAQIVNRGGLGPTVGVECNCIVTRVTIGVITVRRERA